MPTVTLGDSATSKLIDLLDRLEELDKYLADEVQEPGAETFSLDISEYVHDLRAALHQDTNSG